MSYMELYMEELRDLLDLNTSSKDITIREDDQGNTGEIWPHIVSVLCMVMLDGEYCIYIIHMHILSIKWSRHMIKLCRRNVSAFS